LICLTVKVQDRPLEQNKNKKLFSSTTLQRRFAEQRT